MSRRWDAWSRVAVAAHVVLAPASALVVVAIAQAGSWPIVAVVVLAAIVLHAALAVAARHPRTALAIASPAMLALAIAPMPGWSTGVLLPTAACFLLVSWRVVALAPPPWPRVALVVGVAGVVLAEGIAAARLDGDAPAGLQLLEAGLVLAVVVGTWAAAARARRARERVETEQRVRLAEARRAERASVRRDLHDVIGHSLTLMVAQAEAARIGATDAATRDAVAQVAETGREAVAGLRAMLRVLDADPAGTELVPSIDAIPAIVASATTSVHAVTWTESGERASLVADAETALVRVTQEGIANALRHVLPPVAVDVRLRWREDSVTLEVADDGGTGTREGIPGSGLDGLAKRIAAAGGQLDVERGRTGWRLSATVPTRGVA